MEEASQDWWRPGMTGAIEFWNESSVPKKGVHLRADVEVIVAKIVTHGQDVVALEDLMSKKSSIKGQFEHTGA